MGSTSTPTPSEPSTSDPLPCLEFEEQMLRECVSEDCLVITSHGLGLEKLVLQVIRTYFEPELIVFVLGASDSLIDYALHKFGDQRFPVNRRPQNIDSDVSVKERLKWYKEGGVFFVTSRILVVDMLLNRIPFDAIQGIIMYNAHTILDNHQESFILKLYRLNNKQGFIKGFSQSISAFKGFGKLDRIMRHLFVKKVFLWPRSRKEVVTSLDKYEKPDVIELRFQLTAPMNDIQFAIMDLINICLKQMREQSHGLFAEADELCIENAITHNFQRFLRRAFEPVWNQLPFKTKKVVDDIRVLRSLLFALTDEDCVSFYRLSCSIRHGIKIDSNVADWIFADEAEILFLGAKQRVISTNGIKEEVSLEMNPKWTSFCEIVQEIKDQTKKEKEDVGEQEDPLPAKKKKENEVSILVLVRDDWMVSKLRDALDKGPDVVLTELYAKTNVALEEEMASSPTKQPTEPQSTSTSTPQKEGTSNIQSTSSLSKANSDGKNKKLKPNLNESRISLTDVLVEFEQFQDHKKTDHNDGIDVIFHSHYDGYLGLQEKLDKYQPMYVILYDPDMESIRRLEIYQAIHCAPRQLKIFFMMFDASAEEQRYLTTLRNERESFSQLKEDIKNMVVPEERDGKTGDNPDLIRDAGIVGAVKFSNRAVSRNQVIRQKVIVDMREFNSELPSLIHKRGMDIEPVTIAIGDYILSSTTAVERKSISDLIGSLNNGRLYNQTAHMTRHYIRPVLLIEFDANKHFNLRGKINFDQSKGGPPTLELDPLRKLILLCIHYPRLRIIWSPSPSFSAEMFEYLKLDNDQPDTEKALNIGTEQLPVQNYTDKFDLELKQFLLSLPGVNLHNVYRLMTSYINVLDLLTASAEDLGKVLESSRNGDALYDSLHSSLVSVCLNKQKIKDQNVLSKKSKNSPTKKLAGGGVRGGGGNR